VQWNIFTLTLGIYHQQPYFVLCSFVEEDHANAAAFSRSFARPAYFPKATTALDNIAYIRSLGEPSTKLSALIFTPQ
jgi:hypothetical protein